MVDDGWFPDIRYPNDNDSFVRGSSPVVPVGALYQPKIKISF